MPRSLLVTGAAGFIGSHFVLEHIRKFPADNIVVLDALTYAGSKEHLASVLPSITFVQGDIADAVLVPKLLKQHNIDTIVNFAAETHVDRSISDPSPFLHTNVLGVQNLVNACRAIPSIRLLHVSTDEVYGDLEDTDRPKIITDPLRPSSPYAASKASSDLLVQAAVRTYGIKAAISRCTNNFGPHQAQEKFIPTVIRCALADQPIPIYAAGKNKRDWLYVTDHCAALESALKTPELFEQCSIVHVSADDERENIAVAKAILKLLKKPESLLSFVADRPGHDWRYALDSSKTHELGWKPEIDFDEGLSRTIHWYRSHVRC
jgi:dTDP-glucose 4,6-dehydratase